MTNTLILGYFIAINVIAFATYGIDKWKAMHYHWRIPEATLFLLALIGGGIGAWAAMYLFRHKTKHKSFVYGIPFIIVMHLVFSYMIYDSLTKI